MDASAPIPARRKIAASAPRRAGPGAGAGGSGGAGGGSVRQGGARSGSAREADLYVELPSGKLRAVHVKTSITDGNVTAVETDQLKDGDEVVLGLATIRAMSNGAQGGGRGPGMGRM